MPYSWHGPLCPILHFPDVILSNTWLLSRFKQEYDVCVVYLQIVVRSPHLPPCINEEMSTEIHNCELMHERSSILTHLPLGASTFMSPCQNNYISFCSQAVSEEEKVFKGCAVPSKPIPSEHNRLTAYLELWVPPSFHISLWQSLTFYF